jgi:hypothetical protein
MKSNCSSATVMSLDLGSRLVAVLLIASAMLCTSCASVLSTNHVDSFETGGLGLTRGDWEKTHKPDPTARPIGYERNAFYPDGGYHVSFWYEDPQTQNSQDAKINQIWFKGRASTDEAQLAEAVTLLPADAQLVEKGQVPLQSGTANRGDSWAIYHSKSLETRFPALPSAPDPWKGHNPGTIYVGYATHTNYITISADLVRLPVAEPTSKPPEVTPTITPFVLLPTAIPTQPRPPRPVPSLPPPVPSAPKIAR